MQNKGAPLLPLHPAFGLPFHSMDFNTLMLEIGELSETGAKRMFFATSLPWLLDYAKAPLLCPNRADYILVADSNLSRMLVRIGINIKMPLEYFEFPEQVARICAHYGLSLMHVSDAALKSDILVSDGHVPLSWELFTHFKTTGPLDEIDAESIWASANDSASDVIVLCTSPESIRKYAPKIYSNLNGGILLCIPQDQERNKVVEKIDNVLGPLLLLNEESKFFEHLRRSTSIPRPSSISYDDSMDPVVIRIHGILNTETIPELLRMADKILAMDKDIFIDLSSTEAISLKGLGAMHKIILNSAHRGRKVNFNKVSDMVVNTLHKAGLSQFVDEIPPIISDLPTD